MVSFMLFSFHTIELVTYWVCTYYKLFPSPPNPASSPSPLSSSLQTPALLTSLLSLFSSPKQWWVLKMYISLCFNIRIRIFTLDLFPFIYSKIPPNSLNNFEFGKEKQEVKSQVVLAFCPPQPSLQKKEHRFVSQHGVYILGYCSSTGVLSILINIWNSH